MLVAETAEQHSMSNVIPIFAAVTVAPHADTHDPTIRASLRGAAQRFWRRARRTVEAWGWLCAALSLYAMVIV